MTDLRETLVAAGKKLINEGFTVETWGNISVRDPGTGLIYLTPSGMPYNTLTPEDVVVLNPDGSIRQGSRKPLQLHQRRRPGDEILGSGR